MKKAWSEMERSSKQSTDKMNNGLNGLNINIKRVLQSMAGFMVYDLGKKLVGGFVSATKAGIDYNATLETSQIAWTTLLGTQGKANKMLKDIEQFAKSTPFDKMGVDNMAKQLNNAEFEGKGLFGQLTKFGDIGGAFGIQQASLEEMVRQYSQVKQAGVAYTEDLNILQDRGVPIYKAIAKECGISTAEVKKWASDGKISADIYQKALDGVAKGVEGGMAKQSKSFSGMVSTLKDGFGQAIGILSKPLFDKLTKGLAGFMPIMDKVIDSLGKKGLMKAIQEFAPSIMPFVQMAISIFKTMGDTVGVIIQSMASFWNEHKGWLMPLITGLFTFISAIVTNTITAIGAIVQSGLAVIDGVINFFQNLFKGNFKGCWDSIKQIFSNALKFVWSLMQVQFAVNLPAMIKGFGKGAIGIFKGMWTSVKSFFSGGISSCLNFVKNLLTGAKSNFSTLKAFGANSFQALWSIAKSMMSRLLSSVTSTISRVPTTIRNFMTQAVGVLKGINLFSIGSSMIKGLMNGIKSMAGGVVKAVSGVVGGAVEKAKKLLKINSPSKVFFEFGEYTGEGLEGGILKKSKDVAKASKDLASSVIGGYSANLKGPNLKASSSSLSTKEKANNGLTVHIENFVNNTEKDIERLATELSFYMKRKLV